MRPWKHCYHVSYQTQGGTFGHALVTTRRKIKREGHYAALVAEMKQDQGLASDDILVLRSINYLGRRWRWQQ